jgi:ComF family protein
VVPRLRTLLRDAGRELLDDADACVPVPLHWRRRWTRGFNQAEWLAEGLGVPTARLLRRRRWTAPQVGLPEAGRHGNVRDAFAWNDREARRLGLPDGRLARGAVIVLVDDVATTGATLEACARVLRSRGAGDVRALTAARAVRARPA